MSWFVYTLEAKAFKFEDCSISTFLICNIEVLSTILNDNYNASNIVEP